MTIDQPCVAHIWIEQAIPDGPICIERVSRHPDWPDSFVIEMRSPVWMKERRTEAVRELRLLPHGQTEPFVETEGGLAYNESESGGRGRLTVIVYHLDPPEGYYAGILASEPSALEFRRRD